jgi:hypothetical protein
LTKVTKLKQEFPTNPYIKGLVSATWGVISASKVLEYTLDQINEKELDVGLKNTHQYVIVGRNIVKGEDIYELINQDSAYAFNLRLKPWVTAKSRDDMGKLALDYLDNVVRCQTDSISFDKYIDINDTAYVLEQKTTGLIHWQNVNCYYNKTTGYKSKNYDRQLQSHS